MNPILNEQWSGPGFYVYDIPESSVTAYVKKQPGEWSFFAEGSVDGIAVTLNLRKPTREEVEEAGFRVLRALEKPGDPT